jgi:hypothetical protein
VAKVKWWGLIFITLSAGKHNYSAQKDKFSAHAGNVKYQAQYAKQSACPPVISDTCIKTYRTLMEGLFDEQ